MPRIGPLLLSFDVEDWEQLIHQRIGRKRWDERSVSFERQMRAIFELLDARGARATFFMLGMTIQRYPDIAQEIARRGDEVGCHGYGHQLVHTLTRDAFRADLRKSLELINRLTGQTPLGYRAPAFSISRDVTWAFEELADAGLAYDSSLNDSPTVKRRVGGIPAGPFRMRLGSGRELVEFPLTQWRKAGLSLPVGGGSYWRFLPTRALNAALGSVISSQGSAALYFHPYECDPEFLRAVPEPDAPIAQRVRARWYTLRYRPAQRRLTERLGAVTSHFEISTYGAAHEQIRVSDVARTRSLSPSGHIV